MEALGLRGGASGDCRLLSVAFSALPQRGPHLCLIVSDEGEGTWVPLLSRNIREFADLFKTTAWPFLCSLFKCEQSVLEPSI